MSTHALRTSSEAGPATAGPRWGSLLLKHADLVVLLLAVPVFLLADLPLLGYAACAGAWIVQRALRGGLARRASTATSPRAVAGLLGMAMIARVWIVALAILAAGLVDRDAGLPAALLAVVLFQAYFTAEMVTRSRQAKGRA